MSTLENRQDALKFAAAIVHVKPDADWVAIASAALGFLETGAILTATPTEDPTPAAQRKPRTPAKAAANAESAPAPVASAPNTGPAPGSAQPVAPAPVAATTPAAKEPTPDDVRNALVQCQTRKGGRDVPQAILEKYSPTKVTGGVPKDKYAALIAECNAA